MKFIIFGNTDRWSSAVDLLVKYRPDIQLWGLSSLDLGEYKGADVTFSLREVCELFHKGDIDGVININGENPYFFNLLEELGISKIYVLPSYLVLQEKQGELSSEEYFVYPYKEVSPELMQLEFHLADHCNLNCKGCTHFSNLVPEPTYAEYEEFEKDLRQLARHFSHIHKFFLLGGEPLLNPDVARYVTALHAVFPYTKIILVTNGLLLLSIKPDLVDFLRENHVHISISAYECLDVDKIKRFVQHHQLSAELRIEKDVFSKFINLKGNSQADKIFEQCPRKNCTFLGKGRIAACCLPFVAKYFNNYFNESIPEMESIDLYEPELTGHEIQKRLITPMNTCRYCSKDVEFEWEISSSPFQKDDWCI